MPAAWYTTVSTVVPVLLLGVLAGGHQHCNTCHIPHAPRLGSGRSGWSRRSGAPRRPPPPPPRRRCPMPAGTPRRRRSSSRSRSPRRKCALTWWRRGGEFGAETGAAAAAGAHLQPRHNSTPHPTKRERVNRPESESVTTQSNTTRRLLVSN
eukprot:COSAG02_NODE_7754_length_2861_cov_87.926865_2_plen_152_part_00